MVGDLLHHTVEAYSDNLWVYTKEDSFELHMQHCSALLERLEACKMSLKPPKCFIGMKTLNIVGYIISQEGMRVNPTRLQLIQDFQMPTSKTAVRRLLGLANQFGIHVNKYAHIVAPLAALTKKIWPATWSSTQVPEGAWVAFKRLKEVLQSPPILGIPNSTDKYTLQTDASDVAIAGCLTQMQQQQVKLIACIRRVLQPAERK